MGCDQNRAKTRKIVQTIPNDHEKLAWREGQTVLGVDEVGRGCLAGPLVAAAVILPIWATRSIKSRMLRDSKLMTALQREEAYEWIVAQCRYGVGIIHPRAIDRVNIWHATLLAMKRAIFGLFATNPAMQKPQVILVDAMPVNLFESAAYADIPVLSFPRAEQQSSSVAAASIVAKVTRDRLMERLASSFPAYALEQHKGYATKIHRGAISADGHAIIHRLSFLRSNKQKEERDDRGRQGTIC